jgi:DNA-binding response OmpR family regulator
MSPTASPGPGATVDGLTLCRWIPERLQTPLTMLTARVDEATRIVAVDLGADDRLHARSLATA